VKAERSFLGASRTSRQTEDYRRVEALVGALRDAFRPLGGYGKKVEAGMVSRLAAAAARLGDAIDFKFEDESKERLFEKVVRRKLGNFEKLLAGLSGLRTPEDWDAFRKRNGSGSKSVWEKVYDYSSMLLRAISSLDVEVEGHFDVGGWSVVQLTSPRGDWSRSLGNALDWELREATRRVAAAGLGAVAGGRVLAYPAKVLPGVYGGGALAYYQKSKDLMAVAAAGDPRRVVRTLVHEMGHRYYYRVMAGAGRSAWGEFFGANVGLADVDSIISDWERWAEANSGDYWVGKYGRFLGTYAGHLAKTDPGSLMWLEMVARAIGIDEPQSLSGYKRGAVPGLDQLKARKGEAKVFLHPVTAYSGTSPEELFAETFANVVTMGPASVPEIVREAFKKAVPRFRGASGGGASKVDGRMAASELLLAARELVAAEESI